MNIRIALIKKVKSIVKNNFAMKSVTFHFNILDEIYN